MAHIQSPCSHCGNLIHWPRRAKIGHSVRCRRCRNRVKLTAAVVNSPNQGVAPSSVHSSGAIPVWAKTLLLWIGGLFIAGLILREILYVILGGIVLKVWSKFR